MNTNGINALDLESSTLKLVGDPAQRSRGVGTGEDVLVHEQTPDQIFVLPSLAETSVLEEEDTVVVEHVVNLGQESREMADTDVLSHLKTGDLVVTTLGNGDITVVHAQNLALLLGDASLAHGVVAPGGLVASKSDTGDVGAVVDRGETGQGTPTASNVEKGLVLLEVNLFADNGQLVVLELLEGLLLVSVGNDTTGVDHARAKEETVEVITAVVVVADLLLVLGTRVHDELGNHTEEEVADKTNGEAEASPVVAVLHDLEAVALELDVAVKVHLVKGLHGDAVGATVLVAVRLLLEVEVELDGTAGKASLVGLARADGGDDEPVGSQEREVDNQGEEEGGLEATAHLPAQP